MTRFILLLLAAAPLVAQAQIFICKDAAGRTLTADRPIPECANQPMREISKAGVLKQQIPAPLTPEQRRQKDIDDEKHKAEELAAAEKKQNDRILLNRYLTMAELETARKRSMEQWKEKLSVSNGALAIAQRQKKEVQTEIATVKTKNVPQSLRNKSEQADMTIENETKNLRVVEVGIAEAAARFDDMIKRYRELTAAKEAASAANATQTASKQR
ncbi:MAG: DUF4124 domain-containing protein [Pseudomonadota bacterium]